MDSLSIFRICVVLFSYERIKIRHLVIETFMLDILYGVHGNINGDRNNQLGIFKRMKSRYLGTSIYLDRRKIDKPI